MEVVGCILMQKLGEREGIGQRSGLKWRTAEYLVEIPGQYPRHIKFSVKKDDLIARFDQLMGKTVNVSFDINASEYQGKWYNELTAWGLMEYAVGHATPTTTVAPSPTPEAAKNDGTTGAQPDDLPFDKQPEDDGLAF